MMNSSSGRSFRASSSCARSQDIAAISSSLAYSEVTRICDDDPSGVTAAVPRVQMQSLTTSQSRSRSGDWVDRGGHRTSASHSPWRSASVSFAFIVSPSEPEAGVEAARCLFRPDPIRHRSAQREQSRMRQSVENARRRPTCGQPGSGTLTSVAGDLCQSDHGWCLVESRRVLRLSLTETTFHDKRPAGLGDEG